MQTGADAAPALCRRATSSDSSVEQLCLGRFAQGDYRPDLLFGEDGVAQAAKAGPEARWRLQEAPCGTFGCEGKGSRQGRYRNGGSCRADRSQPLVVVGGWRGPNRTEGIGIA